MTKSLAGGYAFLPSIELRAATGDAWEIDLLVIGDSHRFRENRTDVIVGECKDRGGSIDATDVENLRKTAAAFPSQHFRVFILLAKLSAFTDEELELAASLNDDHEPRVILLTDRELDPYDIYERTSKEIGSERLYASDPRDLADTTVRIYPALAPKNPDEL